MKKETYFTVNKNRKKFTSLDAVLDFLRGKEGEFSIYRHTRTCIKKINNSPKQKIGAINKTKFINAVFSFIKRSDSAYLDCSIFSESIKKKICRTSNEYYNFTVRSLVTLIQHYYKNNIEIREDISPRGIDKNVMLVLPNFDLFLPTVCNISRDDLPETLYIKIYHGQSLNNGFTTFFLTSKKKESVY